MLKSESTLLVLLVNDLTTRSWNDTRLIPFYTALLSSFAFLLHKVAHFRASGRNEKPDVSGSITQTEAQYNGRLFRLQQHIKAFGGTQIFIFVIARTLGCFALFGLSTASTIHLNGKTLTMAITYLYASLLAISSLITTRWSRTLTRHNTALLLITFLVYGYRDLWQLATFNERPVDASEGWVLWAEITVLFAVSIIIPLFIPRQYVPTDVSMSFENPDLEQTASLFSLLFYIYLNPLVAKANKLPHLPASELPPLSDYDHSKNITKQAFPLIDVFHGAKRRHIFFGLIRFFRYEFSMVAMFTVLEKLCKFAAPMAINRLLKYLETNGSQATVRPWFWILWLFLGPTLGSLCFQRYLYCTTWILVRTEGLVTQLLFEHSLRIRMKAQTSESSDGGNQEKSKNVTGKLNNLITSDLNNIGRGRDILLLVLSIPIQLVLCMVFLYQILGWSSFAGLGTIIALFPLPGFIASQIKDVQVQGMGRTDARVETVTETINVLRMIKLFGWEPQTNEKIDQKRQEELKWIWKRKILELVNGITNFSIISVTMVVTYGTYTAIMKQDLSASIVFSSMAVFNLLRSELFIFFHFISTMIQAKVSLDRLNDFLRNTELLDTYSENAEPVMEEPSHEDFIGFTDAAFTWSQERKGLESPSPAPFKLCIQGELLFKRSRINLIIGPTGSGKTSILMALLGEMHFVPTTPHSWFNLPRGGGIAYAAQESWVQSDSIRDNILFGSPYSEERYKKVIHQCALERDLELFEAGDRTEVGERGLTLSGGQKARVTLARAIYSSAEIILLDDVLAALDVHTSKWIVDNCLRGDLVKGRTVLLVTHNVMLASPLADFVVAVDIDGNATGQGSDVSIAVSHDPLLASEVQEGLDIAEKEQESLDQPAQKPGAGKLVLAEEIMQGRVSRKAMNIFVSALGGGYPILFMVIWIIGGISAEAMIDFQVWYLGYWGSQYDTHPSSEVPVARYLTVYMVILLFMILTYTGSSGFFMFGSIRASRRIHKNLITSILGTTFRWLDETPTSRVISRCTQDMQAVDGAIPDSFSNLMESGLILLMTIVSVSIFTPSFVFSGIGVAAIGFYLASLYLKTQLSIKREMSNAKSPVLSHFSATVTGLVSIRAFGAQQMFRTESMKRIDHYMCISRSSWNINRWIGIRMNTLGAALTSGLATYLVYKSTINPANIGFSLNMAADMCLAILWSVRVYNDFEVQSNSLERIKGYLEIEQEPKPQQLNQPPAAWPTSGKLVVDKLSARYSPSGPLVLQDISFEVNSGERIGVVGRTGSGKSSLTLSLLRCIPTEGSVYYDDLPTMAMNLDALRSNVTIIPQVPELLSGTLRRNLDPFEQYDDAILNDALRAAGLTSLQDEANEGRITLDSNISAAGGNLSVGQRQIIALARAIVRGSKVLILDEATSAIDYKTDSVIQTTLRNELPSDVTVITVAHRLQTIMDADKIMVLDSGRIVEFDSPKSLLSKQGGMLKSLVDISDDKVTLYAMAKGGV